MRNFKFILFALICSILLSCTSRKKHVAELCSDMAHSWLDTYYQPSRLVPNSFADETIFVSDDGEVAVWEATVTTTPYWFKGQDSILQEQVEIYFKYIEAEDRVVMTKQNYNEIAKISVY